VSDFAQRKSLGQHFLHDQNILRRIAAFATPPAGSGLVEVGPGQGALTEHLLALGAPLVAVERDDRLPALLAERFGAGLRVISADAAQLDWTALLADPALGPQPVLVGNLPYNVGAAIVMAALQARRPPSRIVVMLQREVAERMCAPPGSRAYGLLSVHTQWRAEAQRLLRVGPGAFRPPPKVESAVIALTPRPHPAAAGVDAGAFDRVVGAGFGQRRKTLARALRNGLGLPLAETQGALAALALRPDARAEQLDLAAWAALTTALAPLLPAAPRQEPR
jgi:16S rRNA (adenine1518-N6/adenine1519-N6)-dimethyltransferase